VKPGLLVVYLTVFIDLVGFGIILPQLPYYAEAFGATGVWVGALLTAYSATQFLGASFLGRLSDRIGRRPVLLASLAGSAVSLVLSGLATSLATLVLARALAGLFGGSIAAAQAYVADSTTLEERARYMGFLGASIGLGFVLGPALGSGLARFGFGTAAFVAAGLAAANLVFGLFKLPETHGPERRHLAASRPDFSHLVAALRHPSMGRLLAATFLATLAFVAMEATFALLGEHRFGLDPARLGLVFTYVGVVIVVVQGGLVGPLAARFGERTLASPALPMAVGPAPSPPPAAGPSWARPPGRGPGAHEPDALDAPLARGRRGRARRDARPRPVARRRGPGDRTARRGLALRPGDGRALRRGGGDDGRGRRSREHLPQRLSDVSRRPGGSPLPSP
jgi:DHA1 family tetracycline resistance protein-like MFS transporter